LVKDEKDGLFRLALQMEIRVKCCKFKRKESSMRLLGEGIVKSAAVLLLALGLSSTGKIMADESLKDDGKRDQETKAETQAECVNQCQRPFHDGTLVSTPTHEIEELIAKVNQCIQKCVGKPAAEEGRATCKSAGAVNGKKYELACIDKICSCRVDGKEVMKCEAKNHDCSVIATSSRVKAGCCDFESQPLD
jgi:hypothetical protein